MKRSRGWMSVGLVCLSSLVWVSSLYAVKPRYTGTELKAAGTIVGVVKFEGKIPVQKPLKVTGEDEACHKETILSEDVVVSQDRKIQWAVASIKKIKQGKPFPEEDKDNPVVMDQKGCRFIPHVVVVPVGKTLRFLNNEGIMHNTHLLAKKNQPFNRAMPPRVKTMDTTFKRAERIPVKCDIHTWMKGWVIVTQHPYCAVTGSDGQFRLEDVPAGTHKIEVWHEKLGKQVQEVTVKAGEETRVEFTFKAG